jgi:hypothetical protein
MENLANTESRVMKNSTNTENWVMQDSGGGGRKLEEEKCVAPSKRPAPRWCPRGITRHKNTDCKRCVKESWPRKKEEEEWDYWFNRLWPMTKPKQMWWEKWLAKEEGGSSSDSSRE